MNLGKPIPPHELERLIRECYNQNPCEARRKHLLDLGQWYISKLPMEPGIRGLSQTALYRALGMIPEQPEQGGKGRVTTIEQGGKEPIYAPTPALAKAVAKDEAAKAREVTRPWKTRKRLRFWES